MIQYTEHCIPVRNYEMDCMKKKIILYPYGYSKLHFLKHIFSFLLFNNFNSLFLFRSEKVEGERKKREVLDLASYVYQALNKYD